jgi:hypothetical protein
MKVGLDDLPDLFDRRQRVVMMLAGMIAVRTSLEVTIGRAQVLMETPARICEVNVCPHSPLISYF